MSMQFWFLYIVEMFDVEAVTNKDSKANSD